MKNEESLLKSLLNGNVACIMEIAYRVKDKFSEEEWETLLENIEDSCQVIKEKVAEEFGKNR